MGHHGSPLQLPPAPRRLYCLSSIPSRPCCCPSSSSSSSTCSSSCSSSSLHLSSCCSSCSTCSSSCSASSSSSSCRKKEETSSRGTCSRSGSCRSSCCPCCSSTCRSSSCCCRLHLSTCRSCSSTCCCSSCSSGCSCSSCSDGSSCVCIFGVSTFQGFHSFLLNCFINKQTNKPEICAPCNGFKDIINLIYSSSISLLLFCAFPVVLRIKNQESRCELQQYAALSFKFHSFKCQVL